jgi:hypothetical protein
VGLKLDPRGFVDVDADCPGRSLPSGAGDLVAGRVAVDLAELRQVDGVDERVEDRALDVVVILGLAARRPGLRPLRLCRGDGPLPAIGGPRRLGSEAAARQRQVGNCGWRRRKRRRYATGLACRDVAGWFPAVIGTLSEHYFFLSIDNLEKIGGSFILPPAAFAGLSVPATD